MKLLVCGSRVWKDCGQISRYIATMLCKGYTHIITGGAKGADACAENIAIQFGMELTVVEAEWEKFGKAAGVLRNQKMLELEPDFVIGFMIGESRGTRDMLIRAMKANIPTEVVHGQSSGTQSKLG